MCFVSLTFVGLGRLPHHVHGQPTGRIQAAFGFPSTEETWGCEALVPRPRVLVPLGRGHSAGLALGQQALVVDSGILNYGRVLGILNFRPPNLFQQGQCILIVVKD